LAALSGGLGKQIVNIVKHVLPETMSEEKKAELEQKLLAATHEHETAMLQIAHDADVAFNKRINDMEGTAKDLLRVPVLGQAMLFLRGVQRPAFGFLTLLIDYMVFSGSWTIQADTSVEKAFFAINILVLGFLFGERAIKNVLPLFDRHLKN